ncbi:MULTISPECIES: D-alanyl-D-alanine carboxypeptidase family protein [unclassified Mesorhizobium]|uniref:D-alanyl-D-alanine carboxypeptidase family protein n=1 Tax=unclassified Mesorhizobium TaxID=325217 RepID=UPI000FCA9B0B|nr:MULTISPECIES: D-alanyl-D-alanine carboxypeptidase family protein [unclassified Mesorhizobium]RUV91477.1 D-alanyl-D-alanine carboxypeptidase [Mesorhizobium sp. M1A.F.Ca.IN.020.04.1.1]RUW11746.1 D-alanyl-D-alanine carboxypeptidase [Mesorhizobium sp. M1A.F.Ca.IN.020.03.1.1]RWF74795.1 MAG: D-alanyl-D-alanine carboxypeptidase [Mesorhizobium sp.]RWG10410.1 MAG: D-alanyl-D-alanine carboxypeptidase [Mesorhizobium sp.]RWG25828.1 MAG: D-alanyl-D-alanine carboxypeptidase [Mesorhizobium sp.]
MTALVLLLLIAGCTTAAPPETVLAVPAQPQKYAAIVVDASTGKTLFEVNSTAQRYPASLTKMMTLYMLFEALESGRVSKETQIPVSNHAASQPPTKLRFRRGATIDVDSAIRAMVVKSANDVAVAVGEYLGGGSEDEFAAMMTAKARQLGMTSTNFRNACGLPDDGQVTTARDMAVLGIALQRRFPQHFHYFSESDFMFRGRLVRGHNDMLGRVRGVDGIKTGYIRASGYNIVTSYNADGRHLIVVVMGAQSARQRNDHVEALIQRSLSPMSADAQTRLMYAGQQPAASALPGLPAPSSSLPGLPAQ